MNVSRHHFCHQNIVPSLTRTLHALFVPLPTPYAVGTDQETCLVVQALRLNTLSKLTFADSKRFNSLLADIFVGVAFEDVSQPELEQALHEACQEAHLVVNPAQVHCLITTWKRIQAPFVPSLHPLSFFLF